MIFNFLGVIAVQASREGLMFESEESRAQYSDGKFELEPPAPDFLRLSLSGKRVLDSYQENEIRVLTSEGEWSVPHSFLGGNQSYVFLYEETDQGRYVARNWSGDVLFQMPYFGAEGYFAPGLIALGDEQRWSVFDLTGATVKDIPCSGLSGRFGQARFTDRLFLFRTVSDPTYAIYDVEKREIVSSVSVADCALALLALPGGETWLVDVEGVKRFDHCSSPQTDLQTIHRFVNPLDATQNDVHIWHDTSRVYVASSLSRNSQLLLAIPLDGNGPVEELRWAGAWSITWRGGYLNGYNYLTLERSDLLADNGVMVWEPGQPLSEELVRVDMSPVVEVKEAPSAIKGKHGFHIRIEDTSNNRAVRSAAHEIGRLLGESCNGAYSRALQIQDRKFDGQFHIEITSTAQPTEFERSFLPHYLGFFRDSGGLSPAGSKASLADPIIIWNTPAS